MTDRLALIQNLEIAELRAKNLDLGSRIVDLELETISQRQKIAELEAKLAADQRFKIRDQIVQMRERTEQDRLTAKAAAAEGFEVDDSEDLTAAKLRGD